MESRPTIDDDTHRVREYWNSRPCNIRHSVEPIGTAKYFDQVEARKYMVEPHIPSFANFDKWSGKRVLEVGCGIGTDTMNFARAGAQVTAVDLSKASIDLARRRAEVFELDDRITFVEADAQHLNDYLEPTEFDLIYSFGVIHHSPKPRLIIEQLRDHYCNPATELRVMVYNTFSLKVLRIALLNGHGRFWRLPELVAQHSEAQFGCPTTYTYSRRTIPELLHGFTITDVFVDHIFPYRVPDYVQYKYQKTLLPRLLPARWWRALERRLGWHLCVAALPTPAN